MCGRVKDGDCRWNDDGLVLCHTIRGGVVAAGKRHPDRPYIYCGESDEAQRFGQWLPEHLDDPSKKQERKPLTRTWTYQKWDGTDAPVRRKRTDTPGQDKWVGWERKFPEGLRQADIAPFQWHDTAAQRADGVLLFVVKGELKAEEMTAAGFACISLLDPTERLITELRKLQSQVVLAPDCDLADLEHWYAELNNQLPEARYLLPPMKGMDWRKPPKDGGLGLEDWLQRSKPDQLTIVDTITDKPWKPTGSSELETLGYSELLDRAIDSIRACELDYEMLVRSELKTRFRVSDDRINTDLFKRLGESKVAKVRPTHDSIDMSRVEQLKYRSDGWIQQGDVGLLYGPYGSGKTTLGLWKAYNAAKGQNILDRSHPCKPVKTLIIATDSGLSPLYKAFDDLGIHPDLDPLLKPGHPDQMIHVWGYDPTQGHNAWICDIRGVIQLEQFIQKHGIDYVLIDSAKSVSSAAGWSYTSNEAVKALLKYLREAIAQPLSCFLEFISHDGTLRGAHSGAKAWAEDPSMVCSLDVKKDEDSGLKSVECTFNKDRAAPAGQGLRKVTYYIDDCQLKVVDEVEVVGNCAEAILEVLWTAHQNGVDSVRTSELIDEVFTRYKKTRKTVENSFPELMAKGNARMVRPRRGRYALSPAELQRRTSSPTRVHMKGGGVNPLV